jgi:diketogulonate reductase-like aldo/keto reductase
LVASIHYDTVYGRNEEEAQDGRLRSTDRQPPQYLMRKHDRRGLCKSLTALSVRLCSTHIEKCHLAGKVFLRSGGRHNPHSHINIRVLSMATATTCHIATMMVATVMVRLIRHHIISMFMLAPSLVLLSCSALSLLDGETSPRTVSASPETNFWTARTQNNTSCLSSDSIPAILRLDRETGPLPPGAYHKSTIDEREVTAPCLITIGITPPTQTDDAGEDVWREGVRNCQTLIDSGFNTFRVNNCHFIRNKMNKGDNRKRSPVSAALDSMQQLATNTENRHQSEAKFYQKLRQNTPSSVLRSCHFMVNLEMPLALSGLAQLPGMENEITQAPFGNGWMLKESVSSALLRTKRECLDSVVLECEFSINIITMKMFMLYVVGLTIMQNKSTDSEKSPFHIDALDTLFELKREGLIRSISTKNFPQSLLLEASECGFKAYSNDVHCNLLNTNNLLCNTPSEVPRLISAPLGGGLFTNRYSQFQEWTQLSPARKNKVSDLLECCCTTFARSEMESTLKWKTYRTIFDTLVDMSYKYQVSVESIALRWLLQLNNSDSVCVGTRLGMDLVEDQGGKAYSRHRDFRQVFTFSLEGNDVDELQLAAFVTERRAADPDFDWSDRRLFI